LGAYQGTITQSNTVAISDGGGSLRFYSPATGNVLLGSTTDNGAKLQITGNLSISTAVSGTATDSILTWNAATGVVNRRSLISVKGGSITLSSLSATGPLTYNNTTGVFSFGTLPIASGGTGVTTAATPGAVVFGSTATTLGYTVAGTVGQILTSNGAGTPTWTTSTTLPVTNVLSAASNTLTSTVNGVVANLTPAAGTITSALGFDATGALVKQSSPASAFTVISAADYTVTANDYTIVLSKNAASDRIVTLPASPASGTVYRFINLSSSNKINFSAAIRTANAITTTSLGVGTAYVDGIVVGNKMTIQWDAVDSEWIQVGN